MRGCWAVGLGGLALVAGVCGGLAWREENPVPKFRHAFDIGGGRVLTVWSTRRGGVFNLDPDPLVVYYRVDFGRWAVAPTTYLEHDDRSEFVFRLVTADGGRLACVYSEAPPGDRPLVFLVYDAASGESWPRTRVDQGGTTREAEARWRDRVQRLQAEHPGLPDPFDR